MIVMISVFLYLAGLGLTLGYVEDEIIDDNIALTAAAFWPIFLPILVFYKLGKYFQ